MKDMNKTNLEEKFRQWMIAKGKAKHELTDIFINDNGNITKEKKMAWVMNITADDYKEFCDENGVDYEEVKLLAIY